MTALYVGGMARRQELLQRVDGALRLREGAAIIQDLYLSGKKKRPRRRYPTILGTHDAVRPASYVKERVAAFRRPASPLASAPDPARRADLGSLIEAVKEMA